MLKILLGSFLAVLALTHGVSPERASEPTQMYAVAFGHVGERRQQCQAGDLVRVVQRQCQRDRAAGEVQEVSA